MLNSTEHETSAAHKIFNYMYRKIQKFLALNFSDVEIIMPKNVKMPTIVGILTFMRINIMLCRVEHEKVL